MLRQRSLCLPPPTVRHNCSRLACKCWRIIQRSPLLGGVFAFTPLLGFYPWGPKYDPIILRSMLHFYQLRRLFNLGRQSPPSFLLQRSKQHYTLWLFKICLFRFHLSVIVSGDVSCSWTPWWWREFRLLFSIMDDSAVTLSLSTEEEEEEEWGETEGLLLLLHLPWCNYTNNNTWYVIRIEEESLGGRGVCSSEIFVIPYLIVRLTAIKMFNLGI